MTLRATILAALYEHFDPLAAETEGLHLARAADAAAVAVIARFTVSERPDWRASASSFQTMKDPYEPPTNASGDR